MNEGLKNDLNNIRSGTSKLNQMLKYGADSLTAL